MAIIAQPSVYLAWGKNGDPKVAEVIKKVKKEKIAGITHCGFVGVCAYRGENDICTRKGTCKDQQ